MLQRDFQFLHLATPLITELDFLKNRFAKNLSLPIGLDL
jgi:hypothetical protein